MDADTLISPRYHYRLDRMLSGYQAAGRMDKVTKQIFTPYMSFVNVDDPAISPTGRKHRGVAERRELDHAVEAQH